MTNITTNTRHQDAPSTATNSNSNNISNNKNNKNKNKQQGKKWQHKNNNKNTRKETTKQGQSSIMLSFFNSCHHPSPCTPLGRPQRLNRWIQFKCRTLVVLSESRCMARDSKGCLGVIICVLLSVLLLDYVTDLVYDVIRHVKFLPIRICLNIPLEVNKALASQHLNRKQRTRSAAPNHSAGKGGWMGYGHHHGRGGDPDIGIRIYKLYMCTLIFIYWSWNWSWDQFLSEKTTSLY